MAQQVDFFFDFGPYTYRADSAAGCEDAKQFHVPSQAETSAQSDEARRLAHVEGGRAKGKVVIAMV